LSPPSLQDVSDSETSVTSALSSATDQSVPAPFSPGVLSLNPNDDESPRDALLRARVDRLRAMRMNGSIVTYIDKEKRRNKSIEQIISKTVTSSDAAASALKTFRSGSCAAPLFAPPPHCPSPGPKLRDLFSLPPKIRSVLSRLISPSSAPSYSQLEIFVLCCLSPSLSSSSSSPPPPPLPPSPLYTYHSLPDRALAFCFVPPESKKKDSGALVRLFLHGISAFHGFTACSKHQGKDGAKTFEVRWGAAEEVAESEAQVTLVDEILKARASGNSI
jgi:hypothetical protein